MKTEIQARYSAKLRIDYTKGYSETRREILFKALFKIANAYALDDDERFTYWFGSSSGVNAKFSALDREQLVAAVEAMENYLKGSTIVHLVEPK
jgi:hypothetical protein